MRRTRMVLPLLLVMAALIACATFTQNTYKTLYSVGTAYDVAMKSVRDLKDMGKVTPEQEVEILKIANVYYSAYHAGVDAFETYQITGAAEDKDKLAVALADIASKLTKLVDYINRIRGGLELQPLKIGGVE